jgi:hypothetical protein
LRAVQRADAAAARKAMANHMKTAHARLARAMPAAERASAELPDADHPSRRGSAEAEQRVSAV